MYNVTAALFLGLDNYANVFGHSVIDPYFSLKKMVIPCTETGKLPVRVAVNTGRLPLTPLKRVGYRVER